MRRLLLFTCTALYFGTLAYALDNSVNREESMRNPEGSASSPQGTATGPDQSDRTTSGTQLPAEQRWSDTGDRPNQEDWRTTPQSVKKKSAFKKKNIDRDNSSAKEFSR